MNSTINKYLKDSHFHTKNGWLFLHIQGDPYTRGYQHGFTLAKNINRIINALEFMTLFITGKSFDFFVEAAKNIFLPKIDSEYLEELRGISDGASAAGYEISIEKLAAWNGYAELTSYWWPYGSSDKNDIDTHKNCINHCSAFIATGSSTRNNEIVMGHNTWGDFYKEQYSNLILDINPSNGNRILMQSYPGYINSFTDFFVTGAGIIGCETTISGFNKYKTGGIPEFSRSRKAMQYSSSIIDFTKIMSKENTGGYACSWLLGNVHTNEISRFELGLKYSDFKTLKDGYFIGFNAPESPEIRNLECSYTGYNDIRDNGARRIRLNSFIKNNYGLIDVNLGKIMLADHYNVYLNKKNTPCRNSLCAHYDNDPSQFTGLHSEEPYSPAGSVDSKIITSNLAKEFSFLGIFGRSCGHPFNVKKFCSAHPQWNWQKDYLLDRPRQPWTYFKSIL